MSGVTPETLASQQKFESSMKAIVMTAQKNGADVKYVVAKDAEQRDLVRDRRQQGSAAPGA